ncbi:DNA replication factor Cdt1 [Gigaspora margarita]|uniref:DNA replication factor Cdt1 n=1 Tax=Gigaspora margarita TaxID=4874 RepID=A0A8H4EPD0_GIGMA|nr:DNA replication factor Cdt1 [Gigaspora margarita]
MISRNKYTTILSLAKATKKRVEVDAKQKKVQDAKKKKVPASPVSKKSKSTASRRRKELIDRVRAKGQKTIEEAFQEMANASAKKRQRTMLNRLLDMTDSISFMYMSSNKNVMYLGEVIATLKESLNIPISQNEIVEHLEHLSKIAPDWCTISYSLDQKKLMKINHSFPVKNVLALIEIELVRTAPKSAGQSQPPQ